MTDRPSDERSTEELEELAGRARAEIDRELQPPVPDVTDLLHRGRRRRIGRATATAAVVLVAVALGATLVRAVSHDDGGTHVATEVGPTVPPKLTIVPVVDWDQASLLRDDRTLRVPVGSDPAEDSFCHPTYRMQVIQTEDSVTVAFAARPKPEPTGTDRACEAMALIRHTDVVLDEPLGERPVYNGVSPTPRQVDRWSEYVEPGYLPKGFRADGVNVPGESTETFAQLIYEGPWFLSITQRPAGTAKAPPEGAVPVRVRGHDGYAFASFNGSTVQWTEGGFDLLVSGEGADDDVTTGSLSGATTYVPEDELLKVAEGLIFPKAKPVVTTTAAPSTSTTTSAPETTTTLARDDEESRQDRALVEGVLQLAGGPAGSDPEPVEGMVSFHRSGATPIMVNTQDDGTFVTDLPPGSYDVIGISAKYAGGQGTCTAGAKLVVEARHHVKDLHVTCPRR